MAIRDEVKEQQHKLKGKSFQEKIGYFWDYYKIHTMAVLFLLLVAGIFISDMKNSKDNAFSAIILNSYGYDMQEDFQTDFAAYAGIDTESYNCLIDASSTLSLTSMTQLDLALTQRIAALVQTNGLDSFVSDPAVFGHYAEGMMFRDLREELSQEEYTKYEPYFYYIDAAVLAEKEGTEEDFSAGTQPENAADPTKPSAMTDPVPVGIFLEHSPKLEEWKCYAAEKETPVFGFVSSSENGNLNHLFLQYLTD